MTPDVIAYNDYFPFEGGAFKKQPVAVFSERAGMRQSVPTRYANTDSYRYGFQGQEMDNEIKGVGNSLNYKYRMHDPRLGRFFAVDPLAPEYPWNSPYAFSENTVINAVELEGLEKEVVFFGQKNGTGKINDDNYIKTCATKCANEASITDIQSVSTGQELLLKLKNSTTVENQLSVFVFWGHSWNRGLFLENDKGFYYKQKYSQTDESASTIDLYNSIINGEIQVSDNLLAVFNSCGTLGDGRGGHGRGKAELSTNNIAISFGDKIAQAKAKLAKIGISKFNYTVIGGVDLSNLGPDQFKNDKGIYKLEYEYTIKKSIIVDINNMIGGFPLIKFDTKITRKLKNKEYLGKEIKPSEHIYNPQNDDNE